MFGKLITILGRMVPVAAMGLLLSAGQTLAAEKGWKQPIFLLCPHNTGSGAWSLFFTVDANEHRKVLSLGLERTVKQSSSDSPDGEAIIATPDPNEKSVLIANLDAKHFASLQLAVDKDHLLHVSVARQADGSMKLMIRMRMNPSGRFFVGGTEAEDKRDLVVQYDPVRRLWSVRAKTLHEYMNVKIADAPGRIMSGLVFPLTATEVYFVWGVGDNSDAVMLMDRREALAGD